MFMSGDSAADLNKNKEELKDGGSAEAPAGTEGAGPSRKAADAGFGAAQSQAEDADIKSDNAAGSGGETGEETGKAVEGKAAETASAGSSEEPLKKEGFWTKSNIAGLIFILALIGFNLIIYSGAFNSSGDSPNNPAGIEGEAGPAAAGVNQGPPPLSDGLPHDDDKNGGKPHPPAPPPPPGPGGPADTKWTDSYIKPKGGSNRGFLSGPSVLKCIIYLADTEDGRLRLTAEQRRKCREELKELIAERTEYNTLAAELASYFTPQQLDWYNKHRGDPEIPEDKKQRGGFNYLIDTALGILKDRAGNSKTDAVYKHNFIDTMLNDIVACIIKCEKENDLKLSPGQAAAMLPIMPKLVKLEKKMDELIRFKLCMVFTDEQADWLSKHMNEINIDNHMIMLLYADLTVSGDRGGEAQPAAEGKTDKAAGPSGKGK